MALWPRYYLPVLRDTYSFRDRYDDLFRGFWGPAVPSRSRELGFWNDQFERLLGDVWDLIPALETTSRLRPVHALEFTDPRQCFIRDPEGNPKFQVQFNVKNYKPEEISVSTQGNQLLISAKHEQKDGELVEYREFNRRVDLPPNVLPEAVTSTLSTDGILSISAPVHMPAVEAGKEQAGSEQGGEQAGKEQEQMQTSGSQPLEQQQQQQQQQNAVISKDASGHVATQQHGPRAYFAFQLPVGGFRPDEIKVETKDRTVCISGTHEVRRGDVGYESSCSFRKEYLLPPNADKGKLNVYIKDGRRLVVEAPIGESGEPQPTVHVLPVEHN